MKKNIFKLSALALTGAMALFSCKSTSDEVKPTSGKPTVNVDFVGTDYGVLKNFDVKTTVSTTGDSAFIVLTVNGTQTTDAIYITYQKDNDVAGPWKKHPDGTAIKGLKGSSFDGVTTGKEFNLASNLNSFTYDVNNDVNKAFKLTIPVRLRNTSDAKSDVFTLWLTTGANGSRFDNPAKNLAYGVAVITLNYTTEKLVNNYQTTLGNASDTLGSLFATNTGSNYKRSDAANATTGPTIDFAYNTTGNGATLKYIFGSFYTSTGTEDLVVKGTAGTGCSFGDVSLINNFTKIAETTANFDNIAGDASLISAVDAVISASTTTNKISYSAAPTGNVFAFVTKGGKKGLVKIISAAGECGTAGQAMIQVKVQR